MNCTLVLFGRFNQVIEIPQAVIVNTKNNLPVIPPLHHVLRKPRNKKPPTPSHAARVGDRVRNFNAQKWRKVGGNRNRVRHV
jgi:hypothetical protein